MLIGELAKATGVSKDTIRFYEEIGLISRPRRRENGYKEYPAVLVEHLAMLSKAKELGFTLKELKHLAKLFLSRNLSEKKMQALLQDKLRMIDQRIAELNDLKQNLVKTINEPCEFIERSENRY